MGSSRPENAGKFTYKRNSTYHLRLVTRAATTNCLTAVVSTEGHWKSGWERNPCMFSGNSFWMEPTNWKLSSVLKVTHSTVISTRTRPKVRRLLLVLVSKCSGTDLLYYFYLLKRNIAGQATKHMLHSETYLHFFRTRCYLYSSHQQFAYQEEKRKGPLILGNMVM